MSQQTTIAAAELTPQEGDVPRADQILEGIGEAVQVLNSTWRLTYMNAASRRLFRAQGLDVNTLLGKHFWNELFPLAANTQLETEYSRVMRERVTVEFEYFFTPWQRWHAIRACPLADGSIAIQFSDVTARKQVEHALAAGIRQKDALFRLAERLQRARSLSDINDAALQAIMDALQCQRASVLLFDDAAVMRFVAWHGLSDAYRRTTDGHSPWKPDAIEPQPICMDDVRRAELTPELQQVIANEGIGSLAFIPLVSDGVLIGKFMAYFNAPHDFTGADIELSMTIARQLAFAIDRQRTTEALVQSEARYRATFDNAAIGIAHVTLDGRWLRFNEATSIITGYPADELKSKTFIDITHPDDVRSDGQAAADLIAGKIETYITEKRYLRKSGESIWVRLTVSLLRDHDGAPKQFLSIIEDIHNRKLAEERVLNHARELQLITDTVPVFIAYCDADARYRFVNQAYASRFALTPEACIGKRIAEIVGVEAYKSFEQQVGTVLQGKAVEFDVSIPYGSIGTRFMHCSYAPELNAAGTVMGFVAAIVDITERRRVEMALRNSEEQLKEADRRKDEFIATLAHELRNPLAPMRNGLQVLKLRPNDPERIEWAHGMMGRQLDHMIRLVDDLLDVGRISRGKMMLRRERVSLTDVIHQAIETTRPVIDAAGHTYELHLQAEAMYVDGDAARLAQIVGNLVNNACKFTPRGGQLTLRLVRALDYAVISVRDTGIGVAADQFSRIFELFAQAGTTLERTQSGLGIGLTLVKTLTEMHGGSIEVYSDGENKGSEFVIRLPLSEGPAL